MIFPFASLYRHGFVRTALGCPVSHPGQPGANAVEIARLAKDAAAGNAVLAVFPELCLTGYSVEDLHLQDALLSAAEAAFAALAAETAALETALVVGAPIRFRGAVYNCALVLHRGRLIGVTPKTHLPNYREFYEKRWFASGANVRGETIRFAGQTAPFGTDLLFEAAAIPDLCLHTEICEDLWAPVSPSAEAALAGASVIANLSASNVTIGKAAHRRMLCDAQSAKLACAYLYAAAGPGESTTDLAWDGQASAHELGETLVESERFPKGGALTFADIDLGRIRQERMRLPTFRDGADLTQAKPWRRLSLDIAPPADETPLARAIARFPFVPDEPARRDADCYEAYEIQVHGLMKRIAASGVKTAIIGVSGGLDSTHALIVTAKTFDRLGMSRKAIRAYTLPGFATSEGTKTQAWALMKALGVTGEEIDIRPAAERMLKEIGHPAGRGEKVHDVTYENVQAGLRTDYLFRLANLHHGLVIGTGDLSELALGWCTYGVGDHMSHYGVNAGVPKTLIQHLIRWCVTSGQYDPNTNDVLTAVLAQEISPELVPAGADGKLQSTEDLIGPYALHDFFLHYAMRWGFAPSKIAFLAAAAFAGAYPYSEIRKWLEVFVQRFYGTSQFKRSALPNGPKVSSAGALSPRGDWRAPSDVAAETWLAELRANAPD
jgi:NAD+ synthase (glutamine-hydrolysing)